MGRSCYTVVVLALLLLVASTAWTDEATPEAQAADAVLSAIAAEDHALLAEHAALDSPDPWRVADELCRRGDFDAAAAFAKASSRTLVERLADYVASRRDAEPDDEARAIWTEMKRAYHARESAKYLEAAGRAEPPLDTVTKIQIAMSHGSVLGQLGRAAEGLPHLAASAEAASAIGWLAHAYQAYYRYGKQASSIGRWNIAYEAWTHQLETAQLVESPPWIAHASSVLGNASRGLGRSEEAIRHYERAIEAYERARDPSGVAMGHENLGAALTAVGAHHEAIDHFRRAHDIGQSIGDKNRMARVLGGTSGAYVRLGKFPDAIRANERASKLWAELEDRGGQSAALVRRADIHLKLGETDAAITASEEALALAEKLGSWKHISYAVIGLGKTYLRAARYAEALEMNQRALAISEEHGDKAGAASALTNMGIALAGMGKVQEAYAHHERAFRVASEVNNKRKMARMLISGSTSLRRAGQSEEAIDLLEWAAEILEEHPDLDTQVRLNWTLAATRLDVGDPDGALELVKAGVLAVSAMTDRLAVTEAARLRDVFSGLFYVGVAAALQANDPAGLAWVLEHARAGALRDGLSARGELQAMLPAEIRVRLESAQESERGAIRAYRSVARTGNRKARRRARKAVEAARDALEAVIQDAQRDAQRTASIVFPNPDDLETIQGHLQPGEVLIAYGWTLAQAGALVVSPDAATAVDLGPSAAIAEAVDALLDDERHIDPDAVSALQKLVAEPLKLGPNVKRVLISPVERLGYVPFQLLFDVPVAHVPSGTTLGLLRRAISEPGSDVLALGDPDYTAHAETRESTTRGGNLQALMPLPATRAEVNAVGTVKLLSSAATEKELRTALAKQGRWRAVHLACHGLIDAERPMQSALALTADEENDGFLTVYEVFGMRIPADIAVLSACETGTGALYKTEGIVGLTRAFMHAGAPRVICSLWKVDDAATKALMIKFYELWNPKDGSKGLGAAAALKKAQAFVRDHPDHDWAHPYYWAAWVLWGLPN